MFEPGIYDVEGIFCFCETEGQIVSVKSRKVIKSFQFEVTEGYEYVIFDCVEKINEELPKFLKENGLTRWFPALQLFYNCKDRKLKINYYHCETTYKKMNCENFVEPESLTKSREDVYKMYGLTSKSQNIYAE